jgi:TPR repeat protein
MTKNYSLRRKITLLRPIIERIKEKTTMRILNRIGIAIGVALLSASSSVSANGGPIFGSIGQASMNFNDPPGNFFPGKYFEYKAQFYLKKQDYREALSLFELAGFWANKVAQYNAGLMYYNGIGDVPTDRVRGVAWLGIAAEAHDDLAVRALQIAYVSLSKEERAQAGLLWKDLDAKYGDAVALPRALQRYDMEAKTATGSHLGFIGNLRVYELGTGGGALGESGFAYYQRQESGRDALLDKITGHVTVGAVRALKVGDEAKARASQQPLVEPPMAGSTN